MIKVHPVQPLSFGFLGLLNLNHAFALKAFLEHATLTIDELSKIFRMSRDESLEIFESLANRLLIQPASQPPAERQISVAIIEEDARYRIRPLLIHPITMYLRGKNIAY